MTTSRQGAEVEKTVRNDSETTGTATVSTPTAGALAEGPDRTIIESDSGNAEGGARSAAAGNGLRSRRLPWRPLTTYTVLPVLAMLTALGAGFLKWKVDATDQSERAALQSVQAAVEHTIALLSYKPDSVDTDLTAASQRLTGPFKDSYTSLIRNVVIPGAKEKQISAVATVPAKASVEASESHAVVLLFVDQVTIFGTDTPTNSASSVRVTLDKVDDKWLVSQFDPL